MILFKYSKIVWRVFIYLGFIFILYDNHSFDRAAKHYGTFPPIFAWRLSSSLEFPLYAYALSLELAVLAVVRIDVEYYDHSQINVINFGKGKEAFHSYFRNILDKISSQLTHFQR